MAKKQVYSPQLEKGVLDEIKHLEQQKVPSAQQILEEHKHLVHYEEELRHLLQPVQLAPVQSLGQWKKGMPAVPEIPRVNLSQTSVDKSVKKNKRKA